MKKVVVISSSIRHNSNSEVLARKFEEGAKAAGHEVEYISLKGKQISYCIGCLACQKTGKCVIKDDAWEIVSKCKEADVIAFATPIYYYAVCGQLKTLFDRFNPLYISDYRFREFYLITAAAEEEEHVAEGAITDLKGLIACFPKAELKGVLRGLGIHMGGAVKSRQDLQDSVLEMGKGV